MGFLEDTLLVGGGLAFAEHEHHKHQMQRNSALMNNAGYGFAQPQQQQQGGLGRSMGPGYDQNQFNQQGYNQNNAYQSYGGQDMITVPRSDWDRLQRDAAEGRQQMQRYVEKVEELDRERRKLKQQ